MLGVDIYGTLCHLPEPPLPDIVDNWHLPKKEQKWRRTELPDYFDDVEIGSDGAAILTKQQEAFAEKEVWKCKYGYWFYNNGVLTYITGKMYFYLNWWKLEDDIHPDYRDADRRYFQFLDNWENVLWCLGIGRGKKRREGASSQATSNLIYECIFFTNSNCGLVSKTLIDSKETFTEMVSFGYNQLPVFLKPRLLNRADSVTELAFSVKAQKGAKSQKGTRSKVNYRAPVENAYDRGRKTRVLADEGGKWPLDVKFTKFISKVSKTFIKGAKRVGFCEAPSTVNELTKGGGAEFKKFWDSANQFKAGGKKTTNRFVTYFTEAFDNYEGFIDEYGMSVIDAPTEEQYEYLVKKWVVKDPITGITVSEISEEDIRLGAKAYVYSRRVGLTGDDLEEEIRQNPCTIQEMFEAANTDCYFNSFNINKRKKVIEDNPVFKRRVLFYDTMDGKGTVKWEDVPKSQNFCWEITAFPPPGEENKKDKWGKQDKPGRTKDGAIAVDSYSNSQGGRRYGSKASALIGRRFDMLDPKNTRPVIGHLYGRPPQKDDLHKQVMLAARYYGYRAYYEHTADDYEGFFRDLGMSLYLGIYPLGLIAPEKREKTERHKGTPITPFSLSKQMDGGIAFFNNHCDLIDYIEILENALIFDPYDRTKYDVMVAFLILIFVLTEPVYEPPPPKERLIRMYGDVKAGAYKDPSLAEF